jgi:putative endonuclease
MEYFVYILKSEKDGKRYIGSTSNVDFRFTQHQNGLVTLTKNRRPLALVHQERFQTKTEAHKRELFYKTGKGREYLKSKGL